MIAARWDELLDELRQDNRAGATALTRRAAQGLALLGAAAESSDEPAQSLRVGLRKLATVRPPLGSLFRLAHEAARSLEPIQDPLGYRPTLAEVGERFLAGLTAEHEQTVQRAHRMLEDGERVLTLSASSLVRDTLLMAGKSRRLRVTCLESRPGREGVTLANELAAAGLRVSLVADAAVGRVVTDVGRVLVGGDTFCPAGLIHKLGTYGLAIAARDHGVLVQALLGSLKLLPCEPRSWALDGGPASELADDAHNRVLVWNPYFDLTPVDLIDEVITEKGHEVPQAVALRAAGVPVHPWLADLLK